MCENRPSTPDHPAILAPSLSSNGTKDTNTDLINLNPIVVTAKQVDVEHSSSNRHTSIVIDQIPTSDQITEATPTTATENCSLLNVCMDDHHTVAKDTEHAEAVPSKETDAVPNKETDAVPSKETKQLEADLRARERKLKKREQDADFALKNAASTKTYIAQMEADMASMKDSLRLARLGAQPKQTQVNSDSTQLPCNHSSGCPPNQITQFQSQLNIISQTVNQQQLLISHQQMSIQSLTQQTCTLMSALAQRGIAMPLLTIPPTPLPPASTDSEVHLPSHKVLSEKYSMPQTQVPIYSGMTDIPHDTHAEKTLIQNEVKRRYPTTRVKRHSDIPDNTSKRSQHRTYMHDNELSISQKSEPHMNHTPTRSAGQRKISVNTMTFLRSDLAHRKQDPRPKKRHFRQELHHTDSSYRPSIVRRPVSPGRCQPSPPCSPKNLHYQPLTVHLPPPHKDQDHTISIWDQPNTVNLRRCDDNTSFLSGSHLPNKRM